MPNVTGPMFSLAASGVFGGAIDFMCNSKVRKAKGKPKKNKGWEVEGGKVVTEKQAIARQKFKESTQYWTESISQAVRDEWYAFGNLVMASGKCVGRYVNISGYTAWMKFYLEYGEDGWAEFPSPPPNHIPE